ncbi:hypothetical protein BDR07DRAFT_1397880 [Suillus spraguei]|nr:hypothetical protein BDR07DRAFT_1397880 [Suillus spraguei]
MSVIFITIFLLDSIFLGQVYPISVFFIIRADMPITFPFVNDTFPIVCVVVIVAVVLIFYFHPVPDLDIMLRFLHIVVDSWAWVQSS